MTDQTDKKHDAFDLPEHAQDMDRDELERLVNSPIVLMGLACRDVVDAKEYIQDNPLMWDTLISDTLDSQSAVTSRDTVEEVVGTFFDKMEKYGTMTEDDPDGGAMPPTGGA